jgi:hypothetical protein
LSFTKFQLVLFLVSWTSLMPFLSLWCTQDPYGRNSSYDGRSSYTHPNTGYPSHDGGSSYTHQNTGYPSYDSAGSSYSGYNERQTAKNAPVATSDAETGKLSAWLSS